MPRSPHSRDAAQSNKWPRRNVVQTGSAYSAQSGRCRRCRLRQRLPPNSMNGARARPASGRTSPFPSDLARSRNQRERRRISHGDALDQHVLGDADHDRPGRPLAAVWKARDTISGCALGRRSRSPIWSSSRNRRGSRPPEGLALAHFARHLADEHDERRRILAPMWIPGEAIGGAPRVTKQTGLAGHFPIASASSGATLHGGRR